MLRSRTGQILTGEPVSAHIRAFYVNIISASGRDSRLALGPFATKLRAELRIRDVMRYCSDTYRDGVWFTYGTRGYQPPGPYPNGVLNDVFTFTPSPIDDTAPTPATFEIVDVNEIMALEPTRWSDVLRGIGDLDDVWRVDSGYYAFRRNDGYYYVVDISQLRTLGHNLLAGETDGGDRRDTVERWFVGATVYQTPEKPMERV